MRYFRDHQADPFWGCVALAIEVDDEDWVKREVGIDASGRVVHKCPSEVHRYGSQGFWTGMVPREVEDALASPVGLEAITEQEFETLWHDAPPPPPEHQRRSGWRRALDNISVGWRDPK